VIEAIWHDVRDALRRLWRSPGFAVTSLTSLAVGLSASIAIFSVADHLLIRPLPYKDPSRVVMIWAVNRQLGDEHAKISAANYLNWRSQERLFESVAVFREGPSVLAAGGRVEELRKQLVSADLLPLLGVTPIRGRLFSAAEDRPADDTVLLISYRVWQVWFGGAEDIIGRRVQVNSTPRTIVGVLPPGFYFRDRTVDLWEPLGLNVSQDERRMQARGLFCVARIRRDNTRSQVQAQLTSMAAELEQTAPEFNRGWTVDAEPLQDAAVRDVRTPIVVLLAAVGLLLVVACANVAGLLLSRHADRHREMSVRVALGAGRSRIVRLLLIEGLVVTSIACAIALGLARWLVQGLVAIAPESLVSGAPVSIDWRVVAVGVAMSFASAVACGLVPALLATGRALVPAVRQDTRTTTGSGRLRSGLVSVEVALTVVLLVGGTLLFRSFLGLQSVDPGIAASHVLTFRVFIPAARYQELPRRTQFFARAIADIERLPAVRSASAVSHLPFDGSAPQVKVSVDRLVSPSSGEGAPVTMRTVMPGYFRTLDIPLRDGRDFEPSDNTPDAPRRFIVNDEFRRRYFANAPALGKRLRLQIGDGADGEIIGVVANVKEGSLDSRPAPTVYAIHEPSGYTAMMVVVRSNGDPLSLVEPIRRLVARLDPAEPISVVRTMESILANTYARQRFSALLLTGFATAALLLAAVGIYGILAYSVVQRTREIGIRVALGAGPGRIIRLVLSGVVRTVGSGLVAGLIGAVFLSGALERLLFGISAHDVMTFVVVPVVLATAALLASLVPTLRAIRLEPTLALRKE
jgi:putative ABC transport system permease protein